MSANPGEIAFYLAEGILHGATMTAIFLAVAWVLVKIFTKKKP